MEIANFQVPCPAFYAFVLQAAKSRVGPGIKASEYMCTRWGTITHFSPPTTIVMHTHTHTHTHSPRWLLCAMKSRTGCSTMLSLRSKRSSSKRETLRNGSNPTWPNWHRHQDSDCLFVIVYHISLCQLLLFAPYPWKLARRVYRSSRDSCQTFSVDACYSPNP